MAFVRNEYRAMTKCERRSKHTLCSVETSISYILRFELNVNALIHVLLMSTCTCTKCTVKYSVYVFKEFRHVTVAHSHYGA